MYIFSMPVVLTANLSQSCCVHNTPRPHTHYRRLLLSEGLRFLVDTFHLFPPVDEVIAHAQAACLRREALEVCSHLLEGLVTSLPLGGGGTLEPWGTGYSGGEVSTGTYMWLCNSRSL